MSLREDIRAFAFAEKVPVLPVPTPELPKWDGQIGVTRVTPRQLAIYWRESDDEEEALDGKVRFVVLTACDPDGNKIFQDEDVHWLGTSPLLMPMVERLYSAGLYHNGLTEENRMAWRKNSDGTAGTGLPCSSAGRAPQDLASTSSDS